MKCDWSYMKVKDILSFVVDNRGKTPPTQEYGYPLLEVNAVSATKKFPQYQVVRKYVSQETYDTKFRKGHPQVGDILVPTVGTLGAVSYVDKKNCCIAQNIVALRGNSLICDSNFLYYILSNPTTRKRLLNLDIGGVQPSIKVPHLLELDILLPPLLEQKKIAAILSSLDDKIELNNKINANLQQQAMAIFKSWFLDYEPWNGNKPCKWIDAPLGSFVEIKRGGSPRPIQNYLSDTGLRWLKISDVTSLGSPYILEIKEHIKPEGLRKTVHLNAGELVLSNSATPGIPKFLDVDSCIHDGWLYFPKSQFSKYWLYLFFKHVRQELISLGNGSVFTNLKTDILKNFPVTKADEATLAEFEKLIQPLFETMLNTDRENARLSDLRNNLLPRLISGEIDIEDI